MLEAGTFLTSEILAGVPEHVLNKPATVELLLSNNDELIMTFGRPMTIENPTADALTDKRLLTNLTENGKNYRENEIWREMIDRRTGNRVATEMLVKNHAEVKYELNFTAGACNV